jgi:hypothetical protein
MIGPLSEETKRKIEARLQAYGADPKRWPRADAALFAEANADAEIVKIAAAEAALDAALGASRPPATSPHLQALIMERFSSPAAARPAAPSRKPLFRFAAAGALAASLLLGVAAGAATAQNSTVFDASPSPFLTADESSDFWGEGA